MSLRLKGMVWILAFMAGITGQLEGKPLDVQKEIQGKAVRVEDKKLTQAKPDLSKVKYYGIYFSAGWCPPCQIFTPKLVSFYNEAKKKNPAFEIIFISGDYSEKEMVAYMNKDQMPWLAVDYKKIDATELLRYAREGIPSLVIVNPQGEILADSFRGNTYVGPYVPLNKLATLLGVSGVPEPVL